MNLNVRNKLAKCHIWSINVLKRGHFGKQITRTLKILKCGVGEKLRSVGCFTVIARKNRVERTTVTLRNGEDSATLSKSSTQRVNNREIKVGEFRPRRVTVLIRAECGRQEQRTLRPTGSTVLTANCTGGKQFATMKRGNNSRL